MVAQDAHALEMTTLYVIRHGDRFDYANKAIWTSSVEQLGIDSRDPPLSALGHRQAREAAQHVMRLTGGKIDHLLVSPYLRVIQTAQPLAHACCLSMRIEEGLSEAGHAPDTLATPAQRFAYFPEIEAHAPSHISIAPTSVDPTSGAPNELYPLDYFRRTMRLAETLPRVYAGKTVVCYSHAASVALVAVLARISLAEVGKMAPCGVFKLVGRPGAAWTVEMHGGDNSGHIAESSATTYPWGFSDSRRPISEQWAQALDEIARASL
jgi:broad specificity phosphatase PhoE